MAGDDGNFGECKCTCNRMQRLEWIATGRSCSADGKTIGEPVKWLVFNMSFTPVPLRSSSDCRSPMSYIDAPGSAATGRSVNCAARCCARHPFGHYTYPSPKSASLLLLPSLPFSGTGEPRRCLTSGILCAVFASVVVLATEVDRPVERSRY